MLCGVHVPGATDGLSKIQALSSSLPSAGVLALRSGDDVLRIAPPLVISAEDLSDGIQRIDTALGEL